MTQLNLSGNKIFYGCSVFKLGSVYFSTFNLILIKCFKFKSWQQFGWVFLLFPMIQDF